MITGKIVVDEIDIQYKPKSITVSKKVEIPAWTVKFPHCDNCHKRITVTVIAIYSGDRDIYYLHPDCIEEVTNEL